MFFQEATRHLLPRSPLRIGTAEVRPVNVVRDLGIYIDPDLGIYIDPDLSVRS